MSRGMRLQSINQVAAMGLKVAGAPRKVDAPAIKQPAKHGSKYSQYVDPLCRGEGIALPMYELKFHPTREWRFDFAWPQHKIAVEIDGGLWMKGGAHSLPSNIERDMEKGNAAVILGWRLLRFQPRELSDAVLAAKLMMCAEAA